MTTHIPKWQRVEAILSSGNEPLVKIAWVTSTEWAQIAKEIEAYDPIDSSRPMVKPKPANFRQMRIGKCLTVRNAGTEDQDVVDLLNWRELGQEHKKIFDFRKTNFRTG